MIIHITKNILILALLSSHHQDQDLQNEVPVHAVLPAQAVRDALKRAGPQSGAYKVLPSTPHMGRDQRASQPCEIVAHHHVHHGGVSLSLYTSTMYSLALASFGEDKIARESFPNSSFLKKATEYLGSLSVGKGTRWRAGGGRRGSSRVEE